MAVNDEQRIEVVRFPMLDTGIGKAAGFKDDAELYAAAKAEREAMDPNVRAIADEIDAKMDRAFLYGEEA